MFEYIKFTGLKKEWQNKMVEMEEIHKNELLLMQKKNAEVRANDEMLSRDTHRINVE